MIGRKKKELIYVDVVANGDLQSLHEQVDDLFREKYWDGYFDSITHNGNLYEDLFATGHYYKMVFKERPKTCPGVDVYADPDEVIEHDPMPADAHTPDKIYRYLVDDPRCEFWNLCDRNDINLYTNGESYWVDSQEVVAFENLLNTDELEVDYWEESPIECNIKLYL